MTSETHSYISQTIPLNTLQCGVQAWFEVCSVSMRLLFPHLSISCSHGTRHGMMSLSKTIWFTNNRTNLISIFTLCALLLCGLLSPLVSFSRIVMPIILTSPTHGSWWVEGRCFENTNAKAGLINFDHFLSSKSFHFDLLVTSISSSW